MIARYKPKPKKKGAVASRVKQLFNEAATKGEAQYQADRGAAKSQVKRMAENKLGTHTRSGDQRAISSGDKSQMEKVARDKAAVRATPIQDVETRRSSGMYQGSAPVAGTSSKKLMRQSSSIKGIRKSEAKGSVKRSMIRKMKGAY
jgi:hypothetical protein